MSPKIRLMTIQDYPGVIRLWQQLPGIGLSTADSREAIARFLDHNPTTCFVLEEDDQIFGTVLGGFDGRRGYIYHMAIAESHRRQGWGKSLIEVCMNALKQRGAEKSHLFVYADNLSGRKFWERCGWVQRDELVIMSKDN